MAKGDGLNNPLATEINRASKMGNTHGQTHGMSKHPLYKRYRKFIYEEIPISPLWTNDFSRFVEDISNEIGSPPIDINGNLFCLSRKNEDLPFGPGNIRWRSKNERTAKPLSKCHIVDCERPIHHRNPDVCKYHYARFLRLGNYEGLVMCATKECQNNFVPYTLLVKFCGDCSNKNSQIQLRKARIANRYRLTQEEYEKLISDGCKICGAERSDSTRIVIDHDHSCCNGSMTCGRCIRGALCVTCNTGIGQFGEDIERLQNAIQYLISFRSVL